MAQNDHVSCGQADPRLPQRYGPGLADAQDRKETGLHGCRRDRHGLCLASQVVAGPGINRRLFKHVVLAAPIQVVGGRNGELSHSGKFLCGGTCQSRTRCPGAWNRNGPSNTAFTTLNMAVLAPIPRTKTKLTLGPGLFSSTRTAHLKSYITPHSSHSRSPGTKTGMFLCQAGDPICVKT
jgi:hypothetical protein